SDPRLVAFTIDAPVSVPTGPNVPAEPGVPAEPALPAEPGAPAAAGGPAGPAAAAAGSAVLPAGSGELPNTGAGSLLPLAGLAGGAVLLGVVLLATGRRAATQPTTVRRTSAAALQE
ncbi:MAG TPA: hypothetical protein VF885_05540, partial [Arthrobacter sp.]